MFSNRRSSSSSTMRFSLICFTVLLLLSSGRVKCRNSYNTVQMVHNEGSSSSRQLLPYFQPGVSNLLNPSLQSAYLALQAWKQAITDDPNGVTSTWVGPDVCRYKGIFCAPPPDSSCDLVVAGIDLNHANLAGTLPPELGLLFYLAIFHINTNRFTGDIPSSIAHWVYLTEFDISNNLFAGSFPLVTLSLPCLLYLDIRFNKYSGKLPMALFDKEDLDAVFVNDNQFDGEIPENLGNSPVSVAVFANNGFSGNIPSSIGYMSATLNEIIFSGNRITACVPTEVGALRQLTVLDISFNSISGFLPNSISQLVSLEQLNVAYNLLSGPIPEEICALPNLLNFTASFNFFSSEATRCTALPFKGVTFNDEVNCIPGRPYQRSPQQCATFLRTQQACPTPHLAPPPYLYLSPPPPSPPPPSPPPPRYIYSSPPPPLPTYTYSSPPPPYSNPYPSP